MRILQLRALFVSIILAVSFVQCGDKNNQVKEEELSLTIATDPDNGTTTSKSFDVT